MTEHDLPTKEDLLTPTLEVISSAGGSLGRIEVKDKVAQRVGLSDNQLGVTYPAGRSAGRSVALDRIGWGLSALKLMGALENSSRGVWSITSRGRELLAQGRDAVVTANRTAHNEARRRRKSLTIASERDDRDGDELAEQASESWRAELLTILTSMSPDGFERLCARLLRSLGCRDVEVTRFSDDEGLDGTGVLQVSLLSFPVFFQAKRYKIDHPIQPNKIREFRGAMAHRGDKGFFITTSVFTARARDEARRGGAPIDLIDGETLCDLLYEHGLGVESRPVVVPEFFADL
ncbi:restriction endonuclease [Geodermatophilus sp. SYSU D00079]